MKFNPTEIKTSQLGTDRIEVEIENTEQHFWWRLVVNGSSSEPTGHYTGLLVHKGYAVATAYWDGVLKEFLPFKLTYTEVR